MKNLLRLFLLCAALALCACPVLAEEAQEATVALVNGEPLLESDYVAVENAYFSDYTDAGYDLSDEALMAYVQDLALTSAIERMLVEQDMIAQDCYAFSEETQAWLVEQGTAAYEAALADVGEVIRQNLSLVEDADVTGYALAYAEMLNVTEQDYIDVYRTQYATMNYYDWLIRDNPVTDDAVQAAYDERIANSKALYENDIPAFETALSIGGDVWFKPEGYRSVLQILLPAQGETDEEKLASVKETTDAIERRLAEGESFEALIREYGTDASFNSESFFSVGYQVHQESVVWEDAFVSAAFSMDAPGEHSAPFASTLGVHILYYLSDSPGGAVKLTQDIHDLLSATIYQERTQKALTARIDALAASAEIELY